MSEHEDPSEPLVDEPVANLVASLALSGLACGLGIWLWWRMAPALWTLATMNVPREPIRPMGPVSGLIIFAVGGAIVAFALAVPASGLSRRPIAQIATSLAALASALPMLNVVAFVVILVVRGIRLGD